MRIAIIGGGVAGLTAAWQLARLAPNVAAAGAALHVSLFESSNRLGGIIETVHEGGFVIETGPDGWLTSKPWASDLVAELGLEDELIPSNDAGRKTWIYLRTPEHPTPRLVAMPDGMTLMVPSDLDSLGNSPLFSAAAIAAYREEPVRAGELLASIPAEDESVAAFTLRHFGPEVLERVAAPLLSGVFGGDVHALSARAALPVLVQMERSYGSLIAALAMQQSARAAGRQQVGSGAQSSVRPGVGNSLFTSLRSGVGSLVDRLTAQIPSAWLHLNTTVMGLSREGAGPWAVTSSVGGRRTTDTFDRVFLALPAQAAAGLLSIVDARAASLLPDQSSSAVLVAFAFPDAARVPVPPGFGLLVPPSSTQPLSLRGEGVDVASLRSTETPTLLQACTFVDQKFEYRVPPGGRLLRAFFGGAAATRLAACNNDEIAAIARLELARVLHTYTYAAAPLSGPAPKPLPDPLITVARRLPLSLPQYAVGHLDRIAELQSRLATDLPGLTLLGNGLHGLGIPDVIRESRDAARLAVTALQN